ncbi:thiol reductant ABC exporter subunit CydD [Oricola nitratireducens]|uniref:thiol reductant ABC exporter subunit CydD n=1 Tax=Oricola nitratireducens TaxID=2775868 RepID=UPI0018670FA6|nr:thiol reductant ABC exporter subunit CydD [Oricola nitratireducens]
MSITETEEHDGASERLRRLRRPVHGRLNAASALSVVSALLWIPQAACAAQILAMLVTREPGFLGVWSAVGLFLAIGITRAAVTSYAEGLAFAAADEAIAEARGALVAAESRKSAVVAGAFSSAEIASLAADKLSAVTPYLTRYAPAMARTRAVPLVLLIVAFSISWAVGLVLLVSGPLIPVFMALVGLAARDASERQMQEIGGMNALLLERIRALADLRLLDATRRAVADFDQAADRLRRQTMEVLRIAFLSSAVLELFSAIGVALVAVYVGFALIGEFSFGAYATPLTVSQGIFLLLLAPDFFQPLRDLAAAWHDKAAALAVAGEIAAVEREYALGIVGDGKPATPLTGPATVDVGALAWRTPSDRTIRFPDFHVGAGSAVAITGQSGSGKTTLLSLLAGLAPAAEGHIGVAGQPLDATSADAWRARLTWIGQMPHFVNASLRANLLLAGPERDDARLERALAGASASGIVQALPRGLDTRIGETGYGVSGGEARRLTVARALYSGADIVLADEPTADLDDETADAVIDGLLAIAARGATLIVATHDMRLARRMDQTIALEATS